MCPVKHPFLLPPPSCFFNLARAQDGNGPDVVSAKPVVERMNQASTTPDRRTSLRLTGTPAGDGRSGEGEAMAVLSFSDDGGGGDPGRASGWLGWA